MTRYEKGFIEKCAEYGVDGRKFLFNIEKQAKLDAKGFQKVLKALAEGKDVYGRANGAIDSLMTTGRMTHDVYQNLDQLREFPRLVSNLRKILGLQPKETTFPRILRGARNGGSAMGIPEFRAQQLPKSQAVGEFLDRLGYSAKTQYYDPSKASVLDKYLPGIDELFPRMSSKTPPLR